MPTPPLDKLQRVFVWEVVRISGTELQDKVIGYATSQANAMAVCEKVGTCRVGKRVAALNYGLGYYRDPQPMNVYTVQTKVFGVNDDEKQPLPPVGTPEIKVAPTVSQTTPIPQS